VKQHRREFLDQALPNVLSNLSAPLASLIDTGMLGHLPKIDSLAGVGLAGVIFSYVYWGFGFLRMGTTGLTAKARGAGDRAGVADAFYRGMVMALGIAAVLVVFRPAIAALSFYFLNGSEDVEAAGRAYFYARILGAPAVLGTYVINGWLIGQARPRLSLMLSILLNLGNIAMDAFFILYLRWGAYGAGVANTLAATLAFLFGLALVRRHWGDNPGFSARRVFDREKLSKTLVLKGDILLRTLCLILTLTTFTNFTAGFGKVALTANTLLMRLLTVASYFIDGYAFALEAIAGRCAGAEDPAGVKRTLRIALQFAVATGLLMMGLYLLAGRSVLGVLTSHGDVIDYATTYLPYLAAALAFSTFSYVYDGLFIGLANGRILRDSMAVATSTFLPLAWWAVSRQSMNGLWLSMVAFMAVRTVVLMWRAKAVLRDL
jgi:MATE family multidrug resistance protein